MKSSFLASFLALALAPSAFPVPFQQATPDAPSIWREPAGVLDKGFDITTPDPFFTRAHMPAWRTTSDGRVGIIVETPHYNQGDPNPVFGLMKPELLSAPLLTNTVDLFNWGQPTMFEDDLVEGFEQNGTTRIDWDGDAAWRTTHLCLWDDGDITSVNGKDHYQIKVVATSRQSTPPYPNQPDGIRVTTTPVEVIVTNPKTPQAAIESVTQTGTQTLSATWEGPDPNSPGNTIPFGEFGFEPTIAFDGRLLVVRVSSSNFTWTEPVTGIDHDTPERIDIVYAWSEVANDPANAANWNEVYPITYAPFDTRINNLVGFALEEFRDSKGNKLIDTSATDIAWDIGGTYPWIDRKGDNLMLETINDTLGTKVSGIPLLWALSTVVNIGRYPYEPVPIPGFGIDPLLIQGQENQGRHQGVSVIGKWTHGKLVQLDNLNNDMDYAIGSDGGPDVVDPLDPNANVMGPQRRRVTLYNPNTVPATTTIPPMINAFLSDPNAGKMVFSYGRSTVRMPKGENDNANIIDAIENKLNYRKHALTTAYRDIVWHINNSKQTDQHVFDDSLDPDVLIYANMTGALEYVPPSFSGGVANGWPKYEHKTGWNEGALSFNGVAEVQNAATALPSRWTLPTHGRVTGGGRIEPAAAGGVYGKGFWMDGGSGLRFTIPSQTGSESLVGRDWYMGLFLDARFGDDSTERRVLQFPDGAEVRLLGRHQVLLRDSSGVVAHRATIPAPLTTGGDKQDLLPEGGWAHLGLQLRDGGRDVEVLLNGMPLSRWRSNLDPLFVIGVGDLVVGAHNGQSNGFRGWIDEFKLIAHEVDAETAANHAGATLIGLESSYSGEWDSDFADRFPDWTHAQLSKTLNARGESDFDTYASFYDYRVDYGNDPGTLESLLLANSDVASVRDSIHFPEGPLFHDAPRPFSGDNKFCLSCHHSAGEPGLGLGALTYNAGVHAVNDFRRQPSQPPAKIYGNLPVGVVDITGEPTTAIAAPSGGVDIDPLMMPDWSGAATVVNFTLLDASTEEELMVVDSVAAGASPTPVMIDPALLGTDDFLVRVNLDSAQRRVVAQLKGVGPGFGLITPRVNLSAPYHYSLDLTGLNATMTFTLEATPLNGVKRKMVFVIPQASAAPRVIAGYGSDYQESSPDADWLYGWNASGNVDQVGSFRSLNWNAPNPRYSDTGLFYPEPTGELVWGSLHANGGHPGKGGGQGASQDRFVMAGYRIKFAGHYALQGNVNVTNPSSNGVEVGVLLQSGAAMMNIQAPAGTLALNHAVGPFTSAFLLPGDILWVAVGPGGSDSFDGFTMDFDILFDESPF